MNRLLQMTLAAAIPLLIQPAFAQQPPAATKEAAPAQSAPTPQDVDKQFAKMQEHMATMQAQMDKIRQTKDPQERQRLLQEHWTTMQDTMSLMHGGRGGMMMGGGGGHMMGGRMMGWSDYRNLTPEQLRQRQYMMDRWMPMQQMMMDQMMQHQGWMMQPKPAETPKK